MYDEPMPDQWLSLSEASALLGVHASTLRRWADSGRVPCQRTPGGHRRFNRRKLVQMIEGTSVAGVTYVDPGRAADQAWHKPGLEVSLGVNYNMQDKIFARAELFTRGKMYAKTYEYDVMTGDMEMKAEELKAMVDLNLGLEYRYSGVLSGFLNLNNILGQRYYHWYNYPSYRFNLLLGVTYSF